MRFLSLNNFLVSPFDNYRLVPVFLSLSFLLLLLPFKEKPYLSLVWFFACGRSNVPFLYNLQEELCLSFGDPTKVLSLQFFLLLVWAVFCFDSGCELCAWGFIGTGRLLSLGHNAALWAERHISQKTLSQFCLRISLFAYKYLLALIINLFICQMLMPAPVGLRLSALTTSDLFHSHSDSSGTIRIFQLSNG